MLLTSGESSSGQFMCNRKEAWDNASTTGASITRIGSGGPLYHNENKDNHKETPKCTGNYLGPYSTVRHVCNEPGRALKPCMTATAINLSRMAKYIESPIPQNYMLYLKSAQPDKHLMYIPQLRGIGLFTQ